MVVAIPFRNSSSSLNIVGAGEKTSTIGLKSRDKRGDFLLLPV
jgi:hypothetical protein